MLSLNQIGNQIMLSMFRHQPKAFRMIFLLEVWERFGYYTVQGILTLYFIRQLGFSESTAYETFGAFAALVYGMIAVGGYMGDKILGTKRTIVLGLVILAIGYLSLSLATKSTAFLALAIVCVGNGIFKANPSNLLSKCYHENDPRLHSGFTLYYMAINLGSIVALIIGPLLSLTWGYFYAYFASFIGLMLGLLNYWYQRDLIRDIETLGDKQIVSLKRWLVILCGIVVVIMTATYLLKHLLLTRYLLMAVIACVLGFYFNAMRKESQFMRAKMMVAFILMVEAVIFFTLYLQIPMSLNLFAVNNVSPQLFGITIDAQSFQVLNPLWIVVMSPVLSYFYGVLHAKRIIFSIGHKFAVGMLLAGISFLMLFCTRYCHDSAGIVSSWWLVASYFFQSVGELMISALGVAMVAKLVPVSMTGFVMGMWFLTTAMAGFLGAAVASLTAVPSNMTGSIETLNLYTGVFGNIGLVTMGFGLLMLWFAPKLQKRIVAPR